MSNAIQKLDRVTIDDAQDKIERVVKACDMVKLSELKMLDQAITLATGVRALKQVMTDQIVTEIFMPLQGSQLGFLTDRDTKGGYDLATVRNCWVQGFMWGLQPINNELNIIADKAYAAKNGLERKARQAVDDLVIRPGVPVQSGEKLALLPMRAYFTFKGQRYELIKDQNKLKDGTLFDERYAIRVNAGMGADAVIGKAYRKLYRDILAQITNNAFVMAEGDVYDTTGIEVIDGPAPAPAPPEQDGKRIHVGKSAGSKQPEPTAKQATTPPPAAKSEPSATKPGLLPAEAKDIKRHAKEAGNAKIVEACERILEGAEDFNDVCDVMEYRNAHMAAPREIE